MWGVILERTNTASNIESRHETEAEAMRRAEAIEASGYQAGIVVRYVADGQLWCDVDWQALPLPVRRP